MLRIAGFLALAIGLTGCGVIDTLVDGLRHAHAVENDLEVSTGVKPNVGFQWNNGHLVTGTVTFPQLYQAKPLAQVADLVRSSVTKEFKQTPGAIVLGFSIGTQASGTTAQFLKPGADPRHRTL
jgi:hypothetical protein